MKRSLAFVWLSSILLLLSIGTLIAIRTPELSWLPFQWWIHVALIFIFAYGLWRLKKSSAVAITSFFKGFPVWLLVLAIPAVISITSVMPPNNFDFGKTPEGQVIHRKSWFEERGRFYLRINNGPAVEISNTEYRSLQLSAFEFFASIWVIFSYASLVLWQYVWRLERIRQNDG